MFVGGTRFLRSLAEPWFPTMCARCGAEGGSPCAQCLRDLTAADPIEALWPLTQVLALLRYDEVSRPFIVDLKYCRNWSTVDGFALGMKALLRQLSEVHQRPIITWAPTTDDRARDRGFDQAEILATRLGRDSKIATQRLLWRRPGSHQVGRSRGERFHGVEFLALRPISGTVVVVDDVVTTGATLRAAAIELRSAGASDVVGLALAATPAAQM